MRSILVLFAASACLTFSASAAPLNPLATLRHEHPRLVASDADIARVRELIGANRQAAALYRRLEDEARQIETQPPVEYKLIGPRLLDKSRTALRRIYTLGLLYRIDHKREYFDRALAELRDIAQFQDWHPPHFLDTAEMTHAAAIGYDWFYPELSAADRELIRQAIITKGLDAALPIYEKQEWWTKVTHNWNLVCNGGIGLGALAIAGDDTLATEKANAVLRYALASVPLAFASYAPDGGWAEGPGYWGYATSYAVYFLAGLDSALGTDFGLSRSPGFERAGIFRLYFTGPTQQTFNYADAHSDASSSPALFWLARRFHQPQDAWQEQQLLRLTNSHSALDLLWYEPSAAPPDAAHLPLDAMFTGVNVGFLRTSWTNPDAMWVAAKGGDNHANHSHLDLGSFVFEADGVRWAEDLGSDYYNLPGYFGKQRFSYYRLRTESHNTILVNDGNQNERGVAKMTKDGAAFVIDLRDAYPDVLNGWTRRIRLEHSNTLHIADELSARRPVDALWGMVTRASITLEGNRATLKQFGHSLEAEIHSPERAVFDVISTQPANPQDQNLGTRKLVVRLPGKITQAAIDVTFRSSNSGTR